MALQDERDHPPKGGEDNCDDPPWEEPRGLGFRVRR